MTPSLLNELEILKSTPIAYAFDGSVPFLQWQEKCREKLSQLLGMDKFSSCKSEFTLDYQKKEEGFTEFRFRFQSEPGYFVPCHLLVPDGIEKPPVMIALQGHGTGMHITLGRPKFEKDAEKISGGDRGFAKRCLAEGFACVALEQRNFGETGGNPRPNCHAASLVALLTGRTIIGARVHDIMRLIDVLEGHFSSQVDCSNVFCMGNSGGGTATLYATALEKRIRGAIPSCAFCGFLESLGEQNHCECNYVPQIRNYFDMAEIGGLIAPRPLVVVSGETDGIFPVESAKNEFARLEKIYSFSEKPGNCLHVIGPEGHRFYADLAWEAFNSLIEHNID